ncbi:Exportin-1 [Bienertia sinuspersici]
MSDKIVLKFQYRGSQIDVEVDDVDKVMLIDLVIEYWEKAESNEIMYAKYPEFTYVHKMTYYKLESDKDLMTMINNLLEKKEVFVWWDDNDNDDDNYFSTLYKNGEIYEEQKWGDIVLKPWNLFTDKQHLRDVLRDYCIQCGFSIIVLSANNIKYTVICAAEGCAWRLHAGRLPDGMT